MLDIKVYLSVMLDIKVYLSVMLDIKVYFVNHNTYQRLNDMDTKYIGRNKKLELISVELWYGITVAGLRWTMVRLLIPGFMSDSRDHVNGF